GAAPVRRTRATDGRGPRCAHRRLRARARPLRDARGEAALLLCRRARAAEPAARRVGAASAPVHSHPSTGGFGGRGSDDPPVAGVALIAAVVVALGWPLIRWVSSAPAASGQLSSPAPSVPPRLRVPVVAEPVAKAEERGPALADPPAAPTTASPDAGAAQGSSVRATDVDAGAGDTDARQRDGVPVPEAD